MHTITPLGKMKKRAQGPKEQYGKEPEAGIVVGPEQSLIENTPRVGKRFYSLAPHLGRRERFASQRCLRMMRKHKATTQRII
jgi:hypothetical protein